MVEVASGVVTGVDRGAVTGAVMRMTTKRSNTRTTRTTNKMLIFLNSIYVFDYEAIVTCVGTEGNARLFAQPLLLQKMIIRDTVFWVF